MAFKRSEDWLAHDERLNRMMKAEAERAKPMQEAMRLVYAMLMGGMGAIPPDRAKPPEKRGKRR